MKVYDFAMNLGRALAQAMRVPDVAQAADWYTEANSIAHDIARTYGVRVEIVAAIIAVLSPMTKWGDNVSAARGIIAAHAAGHSDVESAKAYMKTNGFSIVGFDAGKVKALAMLEGDTIEPLRGKKVTNFYKNIMGNDKNGTIDIHMIRAAYNRWVPNKQSQVTSNVYDTIELALRFVARSFGLSTSSAQAMIWVWQRDFRQM